MKNYWLLMHPGNISDYRQQDLLVLEKPEAIRLLFSEKHNRILKKLAEKELSISDIARSMEINPGSVHYHLKELEKQGLVRQVRQEIKGGIVKKYYRSAAKRICLGSPDFDDAMHRDIDPADEFYEKLIGTLEQMGYAAPDKDRLEAKEALIRYDKRIKELLKEVHNPDRDIAGTDGMIVRYACLLIVHMRAQHDPELGRISSQFSRLFFQLQ
jgi:DNA-binding transcriptional ArsR family regulator